MMADSKKLTQNSEVGGRGVSKRRRALVKGSAAAVPVVFTLRSGAALAQTSSGQQCAANNQLEAQRIKPDPLLSEQKFNNFAASDPWVRQTVPCKKVQQVNDQSNSFWVFQSPFNGGQWFKETENTSQGVVFTESPPGMRDANGVGYKIVINDPSVTADVIAIFDQGSNQIVAFGADPGFANITQSCYTSIVTTPL